MLPAPSPEPDPCLPGVCQRCGGIKAMGLRGFLRAPARALWTPRFAVEVPGASMSLSQGQLPAHLIEGPEARGRAEGYRAEKPASSCGVRLHGGAGLDRARLRGPAGPGSVSEGASHRC